MFGTLRASVPRVGWRGTWVPLLIGIAGGILVVVLTSRSPRLALLVGGAIPLGMLAILRPRIGLLLTMFAICLLDEFPGGIGDTNVGGDEFKRSERTPFYALSMGVPSIYAPDVLFGGLLVLYFLKSIMWREHYPFRLDKIGVAMGLIAFATLLSIVIPLCGPSPFGPAVLDLGTLGSIELKNAVVHDVARYVPILQYKLFLTMFPAYFLGLFYFRSARDVEAMITVFGAAMCGAIALAAVRLIRSPSMIAHLVPVVFDTATVAFMAMAVFFSIAAWACGHYGAMRSALQITFSALLVLFILISFRRTMWGAIALVTPLLPFILPRRALGRLMLLFAVTIFVAMLLLGGTPAGHAIASSVLSRIGETNQNNSSTLYRFVLLVWLVHHGTDVPLFGYGFMPLWNELVRIRLLTISLESVHSLYLWILLRMGAIGFLMCTVALGLMFARLREVYRLVEGERYKILVGIIFLSIVMLLFNGIFNPVYAQVRHIITLGFTLALISRLPYIVPTSRHSVPEPPMSRRVPEQS